MREPQKYELTLLQRMPHGGPTDRKEAGQITVKVDGAEQLAETSSTANGTTPCSR